jgi:hypothetical protein
VAANTRTAARKSTARTQSRPRVQDAEPEVTEAEAQEIEADGHYVTALLCGEEVRVIPPGAWRQSWQRLLNQGQIDDFAEKILHPDDVDQYYDADPTNEEFGEFVADAGQQSGESLGKSRGPAPSSRSTRRR